jgi:hypothetical protein
MRDTVLVSPPLDRDRMADEVALIQAARTDPAAFGPLYERHRGRDWYLLTRTSGDEVAFIAHQCTPRQRPNLLCPSSRRRPSGLELGWIDYQSGSYGEDDRGGGEPAMNLSCMLFTF